MPFDQQPYFFGVDGLALKQGCSDAMHRVLVGLEDGVRRLVGVVDEAAHFEVDLAGRLLAEVAMLSDLAAEEDLLFLLAEGERTEAAHAVLADHAAGEVGCRFDIAAGAGGHLVEEDLLSHASAVGRSQAGFKILAGVVVAIVRQVDRDAESHAAGNDGDLVDGVGVARGRTRPWRGRPRDTR